MTEDEIKRLLACVSGRNELIIILMLECGLRKSEVLNLRCDEIFDTYFIVRGKGDKERVVPLSDYAVKRVKAWKKQAKTDTLINCSPNAIKMLFQKLKKKAEIPRLKPHLLRHTFSTYYLINGGNEIGLQAVLGHTSVNMVRKYVHLSQSYIIAKSHLYSPLSGFSGNKKTT